MSDLPATACWQLNTNISRKSKGKKKKGKPCEGSWRSLSEKKWHIILWLVQVSSTRAPRPRSNHDLGCSGGETLTPEHPTSNVATTPEGKIQALVKAISAFKSGGRGLTALKTLRIYLKNIVEVGGFGCCETRLRNVCFLVYRKMIPSSAQLTWRTRRSRNELPTLWVLKPS